MFFADTLFFQKEKESVFASRINDKSLLSADKKVTFYSTRGKNLWENDLNYYLNSAVAQAGLMGSGQNDKLIIITTSATYILARVRD